MKKFTGVLLAIAIVVFIFAAVDNPTLFATIGNFLIDIAQYFHNL